MAFAELPWPRGIVPEPARIYMPERQLLSRTSLTRAASRCWIVAAMRDFERGEQGPRFVHRFRVFLFRDRVRDKARARLHVRHALLDDHGANRDAGIEISGEVEVQDRSAVDTAARPSPSASIFRGTGGHPLEVSTLISRSGFERL